MQKQLVYFVYCILWAMLLNAFEPLFQKYAATGSELDWCWHIEAETLKMAPIFQMPFPNSLSRLKIIFWFKFYWNLFERVQWTMAIIGQIMAWCQRGDKPLPEPMMAFYWCINASWPQWVDNHLWLIISCLHNGALIELFNYWYKPSLKFDKKICVGKVPLLHLLSQVLPIACILTLTFRPYAS